MTKDPSQMDKRTKEYKDWAAAEAAKKTTEISVPEVTTSSAPAVTITAKPAAEDKKPTRPWEKNGVKRPWRRNYFDLQKKHDGFRPRFVSPDKVEARIQRGYVVANPEHYGGLVDIDIRDSAGMGKHITRQGMVLMEIPEEGARAYERQNEEFIRHQYKALKQEVKEEAKAAGFTVEMEEAGLK